MTKIKDPLYEYACHEGNMAMVGILAGSRAEGLWVRLQTATDCAQAEAEHRGSTDWLARLRLPSPLPRRFTLSVSISTLRPDCAKPPLSEPVECSMVGRHLMCNHVIARAGVAR